MQINILYLIETIGPGGAEKMLIDLTSNINKKFFHPIVCLTKKGWLSEKLKYQNTETIIIESKKRFDFIWSIKIAQFIKRRKIDLLHTHLLDSNFYGAIASLLAKCPQVCTEHGDAHHSIYKKDISIWTKYFFIALIAHKIIAVSKFTANKLKKMIYFKDKISVIYNGIDTSIFELNNKEDRILIRKSLGIPDNAIIVICVANLYPAKGHETLLKAISLIYDKLPNLHVILAGKGQLKDTIEKQANILRIQNRIHILGLRNDVPDLLKASDIFVLPSFSEAMPLSLLEAISSGLPVIATNVGGIPEIIEHKKSGFIIPPGDYKLLAMKILELAICDKERKDMGLQAKKIARKKFDISIMTSQYEAIYKEYAKKK